MKIKIASNAGFCFGVKRAIQIATETANQEKKVATLGPIIHNPQMVNYLEQKGIHSFDSIDNVTDETVIIRSHGITADEYRRLQDKGIHVVDATCPFVKKAQQVAEKLTKMGFSLVILGEKHHPEVEALLSYVEDSAIVVSHPDEEIYLKDTSKVGLIAQTTQTEERLEKLAIRLLRMSGELYIANTICYATLERQKATRKLSQEVDIMIVVGGKNSANTARLAEISRAEGSPTYHIETAAELKPEWFVNADTVGITAGASTPDWIIQEVKEAIQNIK
jgi:4-hydroxy-3-methylbut-2-enyl diphosphate reductase